MDLMKREKRKMIDLKEPDRKRLKFSIESDQKQQSQESSQNFREKEMYVESRDQQIWAKLSSITSQ